jgi:hypothetical protein
LFIERQKQFLNVLIFFATAKNPWSFDKTAAVQFPTPDEIRTHASHQNEQGQRRKMAYIATAKQ